MTELFIVMDGTQADAVRGETSPGAWLAPVLLADGETWVLPARVLAIAAYESKRPLLSGLPERTIAPEEWPPSNSPEIP